MWSLRHRAKGLGKGCRFMGLRLRTLGLGRRVWGLRPIWVQGLGFRVVGFVD